MCIFAPEMKKILYITFVILLLNACGGKQEKVSGLLLPVYGEKQLANTEGTDTIYHTIDPFRFVNQFGDTVTEKTTEGKIYVADFFFATCQSICPIMSSQLIRVQEANKNNDVLILSHTVNPMHDTIEVLAEYGNKYGAIRNKWHLLTGSKKEIYELAKNSYLVNALEDDGSVEGFLHSETFLLVDKKKRIRGIYDGTDSVAVGKLISDIKILQTEK
jgi:protein SCO1/2